MKKIVSFILSLALILGILPTVSATGSSNIPRDGLMGEFLFENGLENTAPGGNMKIKTENVQILTADSGFVTKYPKWFGSYQGLQKSEAIRSLSFWVKPGLGEHLKDDNSFTFYRPYHNSHTPSVSYNFQTNQYWIHGGDKVSISKNIWSNITITDDGTNVHTYVNGKKYSKPRGYYYDYLYEHNDFYFMGKVRFYNRVLTDEEVYKLNNEKKADFSIQKLSLSEGTLIKNGDNFKVKIKVLDQGNVGENMDVSYAYDSDAFSNLKTITTDQDKQATTELSIPYNANANTLKIKVNDGTYEHEVIYNIEEYISNSITIKNIAKGGIWKTSATSTKGNITGYSLTENNICNETLTFSEYTGELSFTESQYNGKQVCYKAVHGDNIVTYKISGEMQYIGSATTDVFNSDLFHGYISWKHSSLPKNFDPLYIILTQLPTLNKSSSRSTSYPTMFADINGDSLPDVLITGYSDNGSIQLAYTTMTKTYAILLNKGNMDFEVAYRCIYRHDKTNTNLTGYYGDCAK